MTIPIEELYTLKHTRQFLMDLNDRDQYPRIPKRVRQVALSLLKHYPDQYILDKLWDERIQESNISSLIYPTDCTQNMTS